jgi:hypothetical protein
MEVITSARYPLALFTRMFFALSDLQQPRKYERTWILLKRCLYPLFKVGLGIEYKEHTVRSKAVTDIFFDYAFPVSISLGIESPVLRPRRP